MAFAPRTHQPSPRCSRRKCGAFFFMVSILGVIVWLIEVRYLLFRRVVNGGCPETVRVHQDGEPISHQEGHADLQILSGGANLAPGFSVFYPALVAAALSNERRTLARSVAGFQGVQSIGLPKIADRTFADVVYRSGLCDPKREDLVGTLRRIIEEAGFKFAVTGYCGGTGYPKTKDWTGRSSWTTCDFGCKESKIMLAFERYQPGQAYLSEKLFIPLEYGAVPAYAGNGHEWLRLLTVNPKCYVDRANFKSDEAFAHHLVHLLKNPEELQAIQNEPVFLDPTVAERRIFYFSHPEKYGREGAPELFNLVRSIPKFRGLLDKPVVTYRVKRYADAASTRGLQVALNVSRFEESKPSMCPDIEYDGCCR